ncbi:hypothetical protein B0I35DRAFT_415797, partial [Stachybotrys elegans]
MSSSYPVKASLDDIAQLPTLELSKPIPCDVCIPCKNEHRSTVIRLPCQHLFPKECITKWLLDQTAKCPLDLRDFRQAMQIGPFTPGELDTDHRTGQSSGLPPSAPLISLIPGQHFDGPLSDQTPGPHQHLDGPPMDGTPVPTEPTRLPSYQRS